MEKLTHQAKQERAAETNQEREERIKKVVAITKKKFEAGLWTREKAIDTIEWAAYISEGVAFYTMRNIVHMVDGWEA